MKKIYVLDTSVLLFDHLAINKFQDNDVAIPITVLEELDNFKVGSDSKNFEAREIIRIIDKLSGKNLLHRWVKRPGHGRFKIVNADKDLNSDAVKSYASDKNDHRILNAALSLHQKEKDAKVVLITKDINLRIKAKALGLSAEDYENGKVQDVKKITHESFISLNELNADIIQSLFKKNRIPENGILGTEKKTNHYYLLNNGRSSCLGFYNKMEDSIDLIEKNYVYGIKPKNAEQAFALHALMNDDIKLISLQGVAGTGKTLLALAAALEQEKKYHKIYLARPIVPLSNRDIGFLPGDAKDKISPYMEPLRDNLNFIKSQFAKTEKKHKKILDMEEDGKIEIAPLAYIRGRSIANTMFIIDESQNLTPHEIKTIITRAGEGTKIVFTGDVHQIDTPYLDESSNGLSYLIDKLSGQELFANITLVKGERSDLANLANELL